MKKIILLLFIVVIIPVIIVEDTDKDYEYYNNSYPDLPKDAGWEYVKNRIAITHFKGTDKKYDFKYSGPILFNLVNATDKDSMAFNQVLGNLKDVLPNKKIEHFKNFTGYDFILKSLDQLKKGVSDSIKGYYTRDLVNMTIHLNFEENNDTLISSNQSKFVNPEERDLIFYFGYTRNDSPKLVGLHGYFRPHVLFSFNKRASIEEREKIIQYRAVRLIGATAAKTFIKSSVVNSKIIWSDDKKTQSEIETINDYDWFYLEKLYSENLYKDFKTYLFKTYPWNYASNYLDKEKTKVFSIWLSIALGAVLFLLGFSLLYKRKYKITVFEYFTPILFTLLSCLYVYKIYAYITIPYEFEHWPQYLAIHIIFVIVSMLMAIILLIRNLKSGLFELFISIKVS